MKEEQTTQHNGQKKNEKKTSNDPQNITVHKTTLCEKVCQELAPGRWFPPFSPTKKTDRHNITEILLKVALNFLKPSV
jgi:hypothetical protein